MQEYTITLKFKREICINGSEHWITNITPKMTKRDADLLYQNLGLECPNEFEKE